ncbi:MAG: class I SAM-dependent methyltransferase [Fimbriimonadaceae bacterium]|nr:class I SAM-dependent methyltransferase [Fimbriimonadaceae bacterium]
MAQAFAFHPTYDDPVETFRRAEQLVTEQADAAAAQLYELCRSTPALEAVALVRLAEIANRAGRALESRDLHAEAFRVEPRLTQRILPDDSPNFAYYYSRKNQVSVETCPLCGSAGEPHSAYNTTTNHDFIPGFEPIRLWMRCDGCHHLYASEYPANLGALLSGGCPEHHQYPKADILPSLAPIVGRLRQVSRGDRFLEVGVGAGELAALALEFLFEVEGLDIRPAYAEAVRKRLGIPVSSLPFESFESSTRYHVICMGDVIEHMVDPMSSLRKAKSLLEPNGILWVSTPNWESAFSRLIKDADPMWRVVEHLNYFSYRSLKSTLESLGLEVIDYRVSTHYFGSMEVTARIVT